MRIPVFVALLLLASPALAMDQRSFVVASDDGYGVDTCLGTGGECGRVVATAWCVANGYARSIDYKAQDMADVTGSIAGSAAPKSAVLITCER